MRKNDLIKLLQDIKGNPEVVIWNGFVDDYHHIDAEVTPLTLVKETREFVEWSITAEQHGVPPTKAELDDAMTYRKWEEPNPYVKPEEFERWYGKKKKVLYVLQGKRRGKQSWDRMGTLEY